MYMIYGIKNCDTMRKAFKWLDDNGVEYQFHDYRKEGINEALIRHFIQLVGLEDLINKRSTTWRNLSDETKTNILDESIAIPTIIESPTLIRRPVLINNDRALVGFKAEEYVDFIQ